MSNGPAAADYVVGPSTSYSACNSVRLDYQRHGERTSACYDRIECGGYCQVWYFKVAS